MKHYKSILFYFAIITLFACAKAPQAELDAAKARLEAAKIAEADIYAADSLKAAEDAINAVQTEVDGQAAKFALFRSYEKTKELVNTAKAATDKAKTDADSEKEQVKNEAIELIENSKAELTAAEELMKKAPRHKGPKTDIEALKGDLSTIQPMIDDAQTSLIFGKYMDARDKALAAKEKANSKKNEIRNAIEIAQQKVDKARIYTVWYGTNRKPVDEHNSQKGYSEQREGDPLTIHHGNCEVTIPKTHKFGSVGSPWYKRWLTFTDDRLKVRTIYSATEAEFRAAVREELGKWEETERQALIYLHGFNVSFKEAAIRAAQIGSDLKAPGVTAFFSWPSQATVKGYPADEATIEASEAAITDFMVRFVEDVGVSRVHIIAHSMGNRGLLRVMQRIQANAEYRSRVKFGQIFLAAPDVDAGLFRELANAYPLLSERTTLYVSPADKAVGLSEWIHGAPRAGFTPPVTIVSGIDTVEVPDFDLDILGHRYFAEAAAVLHDMFDLIRHNSPPSERQRLLAAQQSNGARYWIMEP